MTLLTVLPWLALIFATAALVGGILALRGAAKGRRILRVGLIAAAATSLLSFVILIGLFVLIRVDFQYVFSYTGTSVPLRYRIAGAWAGREGSLMLWSTYVAIVAAAVALWHRRRPAGDNRSRLWIETLLAGTAVAYLAAVVAQDTFAPTGAYFLANRPGGNGLNPTLLSPFILIHPPIMFMAYALTIVPAAAAIASLIGGDQTWSRNAMMWSRIDWLLYTFAMGLGGIWAYYTLGFGGYWAWDPVEVANLLPWMALTMYLHAQLHHRRYGSYPHVGPFLAILPLLFTIFSTISTRSGLWVSVHAFTDPTGTFDPDAASRLLAIMAREPSLQFHVGLFLFVLLGFLALWHRRLAHDTGRLSAAARPIAAVLGAAAVVGLVAPRSLIGMALEGAIRIAPGHVGYGLMVLTAAALIVAALPMLLAEETMKRKLDLKMLAFFSIVVLGVGLLVIFLWHIGAVNGWSTESYLRRFPYLSTPVLLGLVLFQTFGIYRKKALPITGAVWFVALVAWALAGATAYMLILAGTAVLVSIQRVAVAGALKGLKRKHQAARLGLWLAALGNVFFWLNPPTIRLGFTSWTPGWPDQFVVGAIAFVGLHFATEVLCGRMRHNGRAHIIVGMLGGFYIAPMVALIAWRINRTALGVSSPQPRVHQVALHATHLAVALVLLGYIVTTYLGAVADLEIRDGETVAFGNSDITLETTLQYADGNRVDRFVPHLQVVHGASSFARPDLYWEPSTGSYFPLPATARFWDGDQYFAVDAICIDPHGVCDQALHWIKAYESGTRLPYPTSVTAVQVQAFSLPGIALVWSSLFMWVYFMGLMMTNGRERD